MKPKSGACTESATSCSRASSPKPLGPRVVHPEARLEVDLAGVVAPLEQHLDRRLGALAFGDPCGPDADPAHGADCTGRVHVG